MTKKKAPQIKNRRVTYFIGAFRKNKLRAIKIGLASRGKVQTRVKHLQCGSADALRLLLAVEGSVERKFHRQFSGYRLKNEWFKPATPILKLIGDLKTIRQLLIQLDPTSSEHLDVASERTGRHHNG